AERHGRRSARIKSIAQHVAGMAVDAPPFVLAGRVCAAYIRRGDQSLSGRALGTEGVDQIAEVADAAAGPRRKHRLIGHARSPAIVVLVLAVVEYRTVVPTAVGPRERQQSPLLGIDVLEF